MQFARNWLVWMPRIALGALMVSSLVPLAAQLAGNGETRVPDMLTVEQQRDLTMQVAAALLGHAESVERVQVWWGGALERRDESIRVRRLRWYTWPDMPMVRDRALVAEDDWVLGVSYWHDPLLNELRRAAPGVTWEFVAGHRAHPGDMTFNPFDPDQSAAVAAMRQVSGAWPVVLLRRSHGDDGHCERAAAEDGPEDNWKEFEVPVLTTEGKPGVWALWRWLASAVVLAVPVWWLFHVSGTDRDMGRVESAAAGWLIGAAAVGGLWWMFGTAGWWLWACAGLLAIIIFLVQTGPNYWQRWWLLEKRSKIIPEREVWWAVGAGTVITAGGFVLIAAIQQGPADNVAALGNWLWKARGVMEWQRWPWDLLASDSEGLHHGGYPPGFPLLIAWGQWGSGEVGRWLPRGWGVMGWALAAFALLAALQSAVGHCSECARKSESSLWLLAGAALAVSGPWLTMANAVQADAWVAAPVLVGWIWLGRWVRGGNFLWLLSGCAMSGLVGGWFKHEGMVFALVGWVACAMARPGALRSLGWWAVGGLIGLSSIVWDAVLRRHGVSPSTSVRHQATHAGEWWERLQVVWEQSATSWLWPGWHAWLDGHSYALWGGLPLIAVLLLSVAARASWHGCDRAQMVVFWASASAGAAVAVMVGIAALPVPMHDVAWAAGVSLDRVGWLPVAAGLVALACATTKTPSSGQGRTLIRTDVGVGSQRNFPSDFK